MPGVSTWQDAYWILSAFGSHYPADMSAEDGEYSTIFHIYDDHWMNLVLTFDGADDVITRIKVRASFDEPDLLSYDPPFTKAYMPYLLPALMEHYGVPSRVLFGVAPWPHELWVFYDELGFLIVYDLKNFAYGSDFISLCLDHENTEFISLFMISPDDDTPLTTLAGLSEGIIGGGYRNYLSYRSDLTLDDFHHLVLDAKEDECIDIPLK